MLPQGRLRVPTVVRRSSRLGLGHREGSQAEVKIAEFARVGRMHGKVDRDAVCAAKRPQLRVAGDGECGGLPWRRVREG